MGANAGSIARSFVVTDAGHAYLALHRSGRCQGCEPRRTHIGASGFRGVSAKPYGRWQATIHVNGVQHNLGSFRSPGAAARAYDAAARALGHPAPLLNFPAETSANKQNALTS